MEYILFVAKEANFQSRTMLIPVELLTKVRKDQFESLKTFSERMSENTYKFIIEYQKKSKFIFSQVNHPMLQFVNFMSSYAYGMDDDCYFGLDDKIWYDKSFINLCGGFDHQQNFERLMNLTEYKNISIKIIEGFLILEGKMDLNSDDLNQLMSKK